MNLCACSLIYSLHTAIRHQDLQCSRFSKEGCFWSKVCYRLIDTALEQAVVPISDPYVKVRIKSHDSMHVMPLSPETTKTVKRVCLWYGKQKVNCKVCVMRIVPKVTHC